MTDLRALLSAATPAPWLQDPDDWDTVWTDVEAGRCISANRDTALARADAALIVALVNQAHTLLLVVEKARAAVAKAQREYAEIVSMPDGSPVAEGECWAEVEALADALYTLDADLNDQYVAPTPEQPT